AACWSEMPSSARPSTRHLYGCGAGRSLDCSCEGRCGAPPPRCWRSQSSAARSGRAPPARKSSAVETPTIFLTISRAFSAWNYKAYYDPVRTCVYPVVGRDVLTVSRRRGLSAAKKASCGGTPIATFGSRATTLGQTAGRRGRQRERERDRARGNAWLAGSGVNPRRDEHRPRGRSRRKHHDRAGQLRGARGG